MAKRPRPHPRKKRKSFDKKIVLEYFGENHIHIDDLSKVCISMAYHKKEGKLVRRDISHLELMHRVNTYILDKR